MAVFYSNVSVTTAAATQSDAGTPQSGSGGSAVYTLLVTTGARSVKIDRDQHIALNGSLSTETDGSFARRIGYAIRSSKYTTDSPKNPSSMMEVDGITTNIFKQDVTEIFNVQQVDSQRNLLNYTLNGLQLTQTSPHVTRIFGTNTQVAAGQRTEDLEMLNELTLVKGGTAYSEEYRGFHFKAVTGTNVDIFAGIRSEFVQWLQLNLGFGLGWLYHGVLKVLQLGGSAKNFEKIENTAWANRMELIEIKIHALRARIQQISGRGRILALGLWRILA
ncbi:MAG TPA: hypothetical protein VHZ55_02925 [Bryobacteraceae bacterium]|jgi:hypothetical protein|nr:hypothetical protein [Bryobacteraceae bacterium]